MRNCTNRGGGGWFISICLFASTVNWGCTEKRVSLLPLSLSHSLFIQRQSLTFPLSSSSASSLCPVLSCPVSYFCRHFFCIQSEVYHFLRPIHFSTLLHLPVWANTTTTTTTLTHWDTYAPKLHFTSLSGDDDDETWLHLSSTDVFFSPHSFLYDDHHNTHSPTIPVCSQLKRRVCSELPF